MLKNTRQPIRKKSTAKIRAALNRAKRENWLDKVRTPSDEIAAANGAYWDYEEQEKLAAYWEEMAFLTEGERAGEKFCRLQWQKDLTEDLFCWKIFSRENARPIRLRKWSFTEAPKKQGKNPTIAEICKYAIFVDAEGKQLNIGVSAFQRRQAERVVKAAYRSAQYHEFLRDICRSRVRDSFVAMEVGDNILETLPGTPEGADGYVGSIIYDEIHRARGSKLFQAIRFAIISSADHFFCGITTAGDSTDSVAWQMRQKTLRIEQGLEFDTSWGGRVYAIPDGADESDPEEWKKANPSLGDTPEHPLKLEQFKQDYEQAVKDGPSDFRNFLRLRLGRWQHAANNWVDPIKWDSGDQARREGLKDCYEPFEVYPLQQYKPFAVGGMDFGAVKDSTALAIVGEYPEEMGRGKDKFFSVVYFWLPEERAAEIPSIPFFDWAEDPNCNLTLTPGNVQDFELVFEQVREIFEKWNIFRFFYDPGFQAEFFTQQLEAEGYERLAFPQTRKHFSPTMKTAERLIESRRLLHNGNRMLTHQLQNMAAEESNGEIKPHKPRFNANNTKQIDGWIAILEALMQFCRYENETAGYEGISIL